MTEKVKRRCDNCRHGVEYKDTEEYTQCRRYPPVLALEGAEYVWSFPSTMAESWCGEWDAKVEYDG